MWKSSKNCCDTTKGTSSTKPKCCSSSTIDHDYPPNSADVETNDCSASSTMPKNPVDNVENATITIFDLPNECVLRIFSYLSFDEVGKSRIVSRTFDAIGRQLLNAGFMNAERCHSRLFQRVRAQLPRRESERRKHALARHVDILTAIETRLSLLSMTFKKYIDNGISCFVPGRVLDEIFRVLKVVDTMPRGCTTPVSHELLRELRDISSMAMEYFDEHLAPMYRENCASASTGSSSSSSSSWVFANLFPPLAPNSFVIDNDIFNSFVVSHSNFSKNSLQSSSNNGAAASASTNDECSNSSSSRPVCVSASRLDTLQRRLRVQNDQLCVYKKELAALHASTRRQQEKLSYQGRLITLQNRRIEAMNKMLLEHESRFSEITAELRNNNSNNIQVDATSATSATTTRKRRSIVDDESLSRDADSTPTNSSHSYDLRSIKMKRK